MALFGNRFLTEPAPSTSFPEAGMSPTDASRLVDEELATEGDPQRNLATFVTTWMEPEAQTDHRGEPPPQLHSRSTTTSSGSGATAAPT